MHRTPGRRQGCVDYKVVTVKPVFGDLAKVTLEHITI